MRLRLVVVTVLSAAFGSSCSGASTERDGRMIDAIRKEHIAAVNAGDVDGIMAHVTEDIVYMPPDTEAVTGARALESFLKDYYGRFDVEMIVYASETVVAGEWAFERGVLSGTSRPSEGGAAEPMSLKYLRVLRRQEGGGWKIARDMFNSNARVPSARDP